MDFKETDVEIIAKKKKKSQFRTEIRPNQDRSQETNLLMTPCIRAREK
jgi:hypothetical protein